jgi:hypothetical protein
MAYKKGESGNPNGRPKGAKNLITTDLKQLVLDTLAKLEKEGKGLDAEASKDPKWFFEHFVKPMLPKDIKIDPSAEMLTLLRHRFTGLHKGDKS